MWLKKFGDPSPPADANATGDAESKRKADNKQGSGHQYPLMTRVGEELGSDAPFKFDPGKGYYTYQRKNFESNFKLSPLGASSEPSGSKGSDETTSLPEVNSAQEVVRKQPKETSKFAAIFRLPFLNLSSRTDKKDKRDNEAPRKEKNMDPS
jgi:hypothetical protein